MEGTNPTGLSPSSLNFLQDPSITSTYDTHPSLHSSFLSDQATSSNELAVTVPLQSSPRAIAAATPSGPSRKQNVACDACRAKKIRCRRTTIAEICEQCAAKSGDCTSNYIEQLQAKAMKAKASRTSNGGEKRPGAPKRKRSKQNEEEEEEEEARRRDSTVSAGLGLVPFATLQSSNRSTLNHAESSTTSQRYYQDSVRLPSARRPSEKQVNLFRFLLSPKPVLHHDFGYSDVSSIELCQTGHSDLWEEQGGDIWKQEATEAHTDLTEAGMRKLAGELVDTFFSVNHPHYAILDPSNIRARLASPDTHPDGPVPHSLLAVLVAFGSRFSEHHLINADREECMSRDEAAHGLGQRPPRSRLIQLLIIRAREVVEVQKTYRIGGLSSVQVSILMESLLAQMPLSADRYQSHDLSVPLRHACSLGYNSSEIVSSIADEQERRMAAGAWSWLYTMDGYRSVFHHTKPLLPNIAYVADLPSMSYASERWPIAALAGSNICRQICTTIWHPDVTRNGIPLSGLESLVIEMTTYRDQHISVLQKDDQQTLTFGSAIMKAALEAWYHTLWLIIERAIRDHGIFEQRKGDNTKSVIASGVAETRKRFREESEHSAMRISGLTTVLALNHYLRHDPLLLYHSIYEAGLYLAEQGREECMILVVGLRQHCIPYPQFWTQAEDIERLYNARLITGPPEAGMQSRNGSISHPVSSESSNLPAPSAEPDTAGLTNILAIDPALESTSYTNANSQVRNGTSASIQNEETEADKYLVSALVDWLRQPQ